jgi:lipoprotein-anchoring transpeptidase ErfK/SrfK
MTPRRGRLIALCVAALLGLLAVFMVEADAAGAQAASGYRLEQQKLDAAVKQALAAGYTTEDLAPVVQKQAELNSAPEPVWVGSRPGFYDGQKASTDSLIGELRQLETTLLDDTRTQAGTSVSYAKTQIDHDRTLGVDDTSLGTIQSEYDAVVKKQGAASTIGQYRSVVKDAQKVSDDAAQVGAAQQAEMNAITAAAAELEQKDGSSIDAIRKEGNAALYNARNDASVAAYEARPGRFQNTVAVNTAYNRMEKLAPKLSSSTLDDVALGAAAAERYAGQIHTLVIQGLGPKHIIVSFIDQHLWAYENGSVVMDTPVTTGIRGVTAYGTDFGPMKILDKYHPYKFKSPWPKGSPYWYPDTTVQWTAFFTSSGEAIHDAYWQPDSTLGPGSQFQSWTRSHGCIHVPYNLAQWTYNWADVGTPVDVYPGDGSPVADQLAQMTTDDQGNPLNPA